jgi:hypothetical protein
MLLSSITEAEALKSRSDFHKLDAGVRKIITQLAQGQADLAHNLDEKFDDLKLHISTQATETDGRLSQTIENQHLVAAREAKKDQLLRSLMFTDMNQRRNMVHDSFSGTFHWIFSSEIQKWDSFIDWLGSDKKLYWVSGKPGSGKSTLMKFIAMDTRTREYLEKNTIILQYYLWRPGNHMQKTSRGILLALLHSLLLQEPSLVDDLLGSSTEFEAKHESSDWSISELRRCLVSCLSSCIRPVCIFIDGLDEIDPSEGAFEIVDLVDSLINIPGVKMCVSSRPEPAFQKKYGSQPRLRLQDLTQRDIETFCNEFMKRFNNDIPQEWIAANTTKQPLWHIAKIVTNKAEGVFLWAHLALNSVRRGHSNSDSWDEVISRINGLPAGLDELYQSIWNRSNIDNGIYQQDIAHCLNLILEYKERGWGLFRNVGTLSVLELAIASNPDMQRALLDNESTVTTGEFTSLCSTLTKRIESRCAGLIEFEKATDTTYKYESGKWDELLPLTELQVNFIHRTASDFLTDTEAGRRILGRDDSTLEDRLVSMLLTAVGTLKLWRLDIHVKYWRYKHIADKFYPQIEDDLLRFDKILAAIWRSKSQLTDVSINRMLREVEPIWEERRKAAVSDMSDLQLHDFLGKAASFGFVSYLRTRFIEIEQQAKLPMSNLYKSYLLQQATAAVDGSVLPRWRYMKHWPRDFTLVRWLLQADVNPSLKWLSHWPHDQVILLTAPITNLIVGGLAAHRESASREWFSKLFDTIEDAVKLRPLAGLRIPFTLLLKQPPSQRTVHDTPYISFYNLIDATGSRKHSWITFDASAAFMLKLLLDLIRSLGSPGFEISDALAEASDYSTLVSREKHEPAIRPIYCSSPQGEDSDLLYSKGLVYCSTAVVIDAELARFQILGCVQDSGATRIAENTRMFNEMHASIVNTYKELQTDMVMEECENLVQGFQFSTWSEASSHPMKFPPPLFDQASH